VTKLRLPSPERYKLRDFAKWAKKAGISDCDLVSALTEMDKGLLGDRLGSHVYKKRLRVAGRGKRGGARTIVLYRAGDVVLFLYGYLKNENDDMSENEVLQVRLFAQQFLALSTAARIRLCTEGRLFAFEG
jgi:hypothetical protein